MKYKLPPNEQELTLVVTRADNAVHVYSTDRRYQRVLHRLCREYPEVYREVWSDPEIAGDGLPVGVRFEFPKKYLRFGKPSTEAQQAARRANAMKMRSKL